MPDRPDVGRGRRAPTWLEELAHLEALSRKPAGAATGDALMTDVPEEEATSADQLAAWLLSQTELG